MCAGDLDDQGGSPQEAEFTADPGGLAANLVFVICGLGKEDGAEIAIAEAIEDEYLHFLPLIFTCETGIKRVETMLDTI